MNGRRRPASGSTAGKFPLTAIDLPISQFIRFALTGVLNTLFGYGLFACLILLSLPSPLSLLVATIGGTLFNYFTVRRLVFASNTDSRLGRFVVAYAVIYALNCIALLAASRAGISPLSAQALLMFIFAVLSFILNKYFVFAEPRAVSDA